MASSEVGETEQLSYVRNKADPSWFPWYVSYYHQSNVG